MTAAIRNILVGIIIFLSLFSMYQYVSGLRQDRVVANLKGEVSKLNHENSVLNSRIETWKTMWFASGKASDTQQEGIKEQEEIERDTKEAITSLPETKPIGDKDVEATKHSLLPTDLARLLQQHCNKVRGSSCDNP